MGQPTLFGRRCGLATPPDAINSDKGTCATSGWDGVPCPTMDDVAARRESRLPRRYSGHFVRMYGLDTPNDSSQDRSIGPAIELVGRGRESSDPHAPFFSLCVDSHPLGYKRGRRTPCKRSEHSHPHSYTHIHNPETWDPRSLSRPFVPPIARARNGRRDIQPEPV